jgi:hypothetical protein
LAAKQVSKEPLPLDKTQRSVAEANLWKMTRSGIIFLSVVLFK